MTLQLANSKLNTGGQVIAKKKYSGVSMSAIQPKHRIFVREVAKGESPEKVIRRLYPHEDVAVAMRRAQTPKVLALLESFVSARWERMILLSRLSAIIADERTKQSERITALRLGAQISGYLNNMATFKPSRRQLKNGTDAETEARLAKLVKQASQSSKPI